MRKSGKIILLLIFTLILSLLVSLSACTQVPEKGTVILWQVTKKHSDTMVYMLGSIHAANDKFYPLDSKIEKYFDNSEYLMVECDVGKYSNQELQNFDLKYASYTTDETFQSKVPSDLFQKVEKVTTAFHLDMKILNKFKPWYFASILAQIRLLDGGYKMEKGLDYHFLNRARGYKEILELESTDTRLAAYAKIPENLQLTMLNETIENNVHAVEDTELLNELWKRADIQGIEAFLSDHVTRDPALKQFEDAIYHDQNTKMLKSIDSLFETGKDCFMVVELGRLVGEDKILDTLVRNGYKIRQL